MYYYNGNVYVEKEDQCLTCSNFTQGVACPLLQALALGMVTLDGTLYVTNCGFYKEFVRQLRLVPKDAKIKSTKKSSKDKDNKDKS